MSSTLMCLIWFCQCDHIIFILDIKPQQMLESMKSLKYVNVNLFVFLALHLLL